MAHRELGDRRDPDRPLAWRDAWRVLLTFSGVTVAWVFFRAPTFAEANQFLAGMMGLGPGGGWPVLPTLLVVACAGLHVLERWARTNGARLREAAHERWWGGAAQAAALGAIVGLAISVAGAGSEFIYFQF